MKKINRGTVPKVEDGWLKIAEFENLGRVWSLYLKGRVSSGGWANMKIALNGESKLKSNFYISFSVRENRFAMNSESVKLLTKINPEFAHAAITSIAQNVGDERLIGAIVKTPFKHNYIE